MLTLVSGSPYFGVVRDFCNAEIEGVTWLLGGLPVQALGYCTGCTSLVLRCLLWSRARSRHRREGP